MTETTETTELAVVNAQNAVQIFTRGGLDAILESVEREVRAKTLDGSTPAGRDEIRSTAYKVIRTKTAIDAEGKALTAGWRQATDQVNAERKRAQARLDALADEVRAPLTEFETREKNRIAGHEAALAEIASLAIWNFGRRTTEDLEARQLTLATLQLDREWQEFRDRASMERKRVGGVLADDLAALRKSEADAAELERLRKEKAERVARERDERLKTAAAESARIDAERRAKEAADAEARRVIEAAELERKRVEAEAERVRAEHERQRKEVLAAQKREQDARELAEKRAADAEAARLKAIADADAAQRQAESDKKAAEEKAAADLKAAQEKATRDAKAAAEAAVAKERERAEKHRKAREQARPIETIAALRAVKDGYDYNPGDSDLDDVQTILVRMHLGDYRRAVRLLSELEGK